MANVLFALFVLAVIVTAVVLALRERSRQEWQHSLVAYALRLPRGLSAADVAAFLTACTGLRAREWQRAISTRAFVLELVATSEGIVHHLLVPGPLADIVLSALRAAIPGALVARDDNYQVQEVEVAAEIGQTDWQRPLAAGHPERIAAALLASVQPLAGGERVVLQWVLEPAAPVAEPVVAQGQARHSSSTLARLVDELVSTRPVDAATAKAIRAKQASPLFIAAGRVGATASTTGQAEALVTRVVAALHTANAPSAHLYRSSWSSGLVREWLHQRSVPLVRQSCVLNADELSGLVAWPLGNLSLPGLALGGTKALAPSSDIPRSGRVILRSTYPGMERPLALSLPDSLRHLHVIGPTGVGKSTLLLGLITQDMQAGRGVVVVDPKGDLVADVLDRVPPERTGDVVVLDPADEQRPVGLNLLARPGESRSWWWTRW